MMNLVQIEPEMLSIQPHALFDLKTLLLTCGDFNQKVFNTMTIGWGSIGTMWNKPCVVVAVRPTRYTFEFMEKYPDFTVTAFPDAYKKALNILGTRSGRDGDKIKLAGLNPMAAHQVLSPSFAEAELSVECRKIYWQDLDPNYFLDPGIHNFYQEHDYHRIYYGEIVHILGSQFYSKAEFNLENSNGISFNEV
jgi:flavin reductase (DIM6/NTAB) family NADH-FMN oxidoreductase RutF